MTGRSWQAAALLCLLLSSNAQGTDSEAGVWAIASTTGAFAADTGPGRWQYWFDMQARYVDLGSGANQWLARPGIGYRFDNGIRGWIGFARFRSRGASGSVAYESRYWQQVDRTFSDWNSGRLALRARLEQRSVSIGDDTGLVLRLMAKYSRPIGTGNKYLVIGLEPFFDLRDTDWGGDAGLGQNRLFVGANLRLGDRTTLEAGYMNQYIWRDQGEDRVNHLGIFNFRVSL